MLGLFGFIAFVRMAILCVTFAFFPFATTYLNASNAPSVPSAFTFACASPLVYSNKFTYNILLVKFFYSFIDAQSFLNGLDVLLLQLLLDFRTIFIQHDLLMYLVPCWIHCHHHCGEQVEPLFEVLWFHVTLLGLRHSLEIEPLDVHDACLHVLSVIFSHQDLLAQLLDFLVFFSSFRLATPATPFWSR